MKAQTEPARYYSSLEGLPSEILTDIFNYLQPAEKASLLRVSKRLHNVVYPSLWHALHWGCREPGEDDTAVKTKNIAKLVQTAKEIGADNMGFNHIKTLKLAGQEFHAAAAPTKNEFFKIICGQLKAGKMNLQTVDLCWDGVVSNGTPWVTTFLKTLKAYPSLKLPKRPRITAGKKSLSNEYPFPSHVFALDCITDLDYGVGTIYFSTNPMSRAITDIDDLTQILKQTPSLEAIRLRGSPYTDDCLYSIHELQGLEQLQQTINNLAFLRKMHLYGLIFHPSFFITPPQTVRELNIRQKVSFAWWRRFVDCPFTNLERMILDPEHISVEYDGRPSKWSEGDFETKRPSEKGFTFMLGYLSMKGLKWFESDVSNLYVPRDLLELVVRNNPGLGSRRIEQLLAENEAYQNLWTTGEKSQWVVMLRDT